VQARDTRSRSRPTSELGQLGAGRVELVEHSASRAEPYTHAPMTMTQGSRRSRDHLRDGPMIDGGDQDTFGDCGADNRTGDAEYGQRAPQQHRGGTTQPLDEGPVQAEHTAA